jgi:hypothetical protein
MLEEVVVEVEVEAAETHPLGVEAEEGEGVVQQRQEVEDVLRSGISMHVQ